MINITDIQVQVTKELANKQTFDTLVATTFKGLKPENIKLAIVEGMIRGFNFQDFLEKNIYAIPFGEKYSLVTSIDYARKLGMRSGVVGKSAPTYDEDNGKIISCSITIKRKTGDYIGDYSSKVYFSEYSTGRNLWTSKPRTMIAKVAEMHALRMACPEEMSQVYVQEEVDKETTLELPEIKIEDYKNKLESTKSLQELGTVWSSLPIKAKEELKVVKDNLKKQYENQPISK